MKTRMFGAFAALMLVSSAYAFDGSVTFDQKGSIAGIIDQVKSANPGADVVPMPGDPKAPKMWTIMVFVNAKNNLESYGLLDVNEMEMVGSDGNVNIVAELGRIAGYSTADGDWKGSRRYLVQKDSDMTKIVSPVVMEIPKSDMGSWQYMAEFAKWAMGQYPAQRYVLVVWNHGSGWNRKELPFEQKGISYDDETGNHITTQQLRQAMAATGRIDILAMDACLMQMIEVAYEVKDYAAYVVASEETEPADGYTYNDFLAPLAKNAAMTSLELSKVMVDAYTNHYQAIGQGATQSSINTGSLGFFTVALNAFVDAVIGANDLTVAKNAKLKTQSFYYSANKDIYHFAKLVSETTADAEVKAKAAALMSLMSTGLIAHNRAAGVRYANAFGLAAYLPGYYSAAYDGLLWAQDSKWDDFQKWLK